MENKKIRNPFKIYSTQEGVNVVHSPIKSEILSFLKQGGLSGSKIVALTGKSKSTISAHLQDLVDAGIIDWKPDPHDRRRKIFYINSQFLGHISKEKEIEREIDHYLDNHVSKSSDPFRFFRFMFRTIRVALLEEGINIDPILQRAGFKVGEAFYGELETSNFDEFTVKLANFWEKNHLGQIELERKEPLIIKAHDCFECGDLPQLGRPACAFDSGILEAVFSRHLGKLVYVEETNCYAQGDQFCRFIIK